MMQVVFPRKEFRIFEHCLSDISKERPLHGESARIFLFLLGQVNTDNQLPGPAAVAETLNLLQPAVSRAYKEMLDYGYLIKAGDIYSLHPFIGFYGTQVQREDAITKVLCLEAVA